MACIVSMLPLVLLVAMPNLTASNVGLQGKEPQDQQPGITVPLPKGKKPILSDGSFQIIREYHGEGDRIRY